MRRGRRRNLSVAALVAVEPGLLARLDADETEQARLTTPPYLHGLITPAPTSPPDGTPCPSAPVAPSPAPCSCPAYFGAPPRPARAPGHGNLHVPAADRVTWIRDTPTPARDSRERGGPRAGTSCGRRADTAPRRVAAPGARAQPAGPPGTVATPAGAGRPGYAVHTTAGNPRVSCIWVRSVTHYLSRVHTWNARGLLCRNAWRLSHPLTEKWIFAMFSFRPIVQPSGEISCRSISVRVQVAASRPPL
jgi:hypothetical protein